MPHPAPDPARDVEAQEKRDLVSFEKWCAAVGYPRQTVPLSAADAFLAGAAKGRSQDVAECSGAIQTLTADRDRLQSELRDLRNEAESAREQARGENALRVEAEAELLRVRVEWGRLSDALDMAKAALPPVFTPDREHNLHECIEALGTERDHWKQTAMDSERLRLTATPPPDYLEKASLRLTAKAEAHLAREARDELERVKVERDATQAAYEKSEAECMNLAMRNDGLQAYIDQIHTRRSLATPPPDSALRERVVEAAMAEHRMFKRNKWARSHWIDGSEAQREWDACAALDAATPKPTDAVREAAGRLRAEMERISSNLVRVETPDLRAVLDALDSARGEGGGE